MLSKRWTIQLATTYWFLSVMILICLTVIVCHNNICKICCPLHIEALMAWLKADISLKMLRNVKPWTPSLLNNRHGVCVCSDSAVPQDSLAIWPAVATAPCWTTLGHLVGAGDSAAGGDHHHGGHQEGHRRGWEGVGGGREAGGQQEKRPDGKCFLFGWLTFSFRSGPTCTVRQRGKTEENVRQQIEPFHFNTIPSFILALQRLL